MSYYKKSDIERFFRKVIDYSNPDKCWIWTGAKSPSGYGIFSNDYKTVRAHRWLFEYYKGELTEKQVLDHTCKVKACVNPAHMEAVDNVTNILRGEIFNRNKTHCKRGHEFTEKNTLYKKRYGIGALYRTCKACNGL